MFNSFLHKTPLSLAGSTLCTPGVFCDRAEFQRNESVGKAKWSLFLRVSLMATALYAMATNFDVTSQSGLRHLDDYLLTRYYISGHQPSRDDILVHAALGQPPGPDFVNLRRWYTHIQALLDTTFPGPALGVIFTVESDVQQSQVEQPQLEQPLVEDTTSVHSSTPGSEILNSAAADRAAYESEDQDNIPNGDLDASHDGTQDEMDKMAEDMEASRIQGRERRNRSSILLDVKPWDDETDMIKLEEVVRGVHIPGLQWGESKLVPVVGEINKLQIIMTIEDDLVSPDKVIEENLTVEPANEHIQSCDIVSWNKLCKMFFSEDKKLNSRFSCKDWD